MAVTDRRIKFRVYGTNEQQDRGQSVTKTPVANTNMTVKPAQQPQIKIPTGLDVIKPTAVNDNTIKPIDTGTVRASKMPLSPVLPSVNTWGSYGPTITPPTPTIPPPVPSPEAPFAQAVKVFQTGAFANNPSAFFQNTTAMRQQIAKMNAIDRVQILRQIAQAMGITPPVQRDASRITQQWATSFLAQYIYRPRGWYKTISSLLDMFSPKGTRGMTGGGRA